MSARSRARPWWGPRVSRAAYRSPPVDILPLIFDDALAPFANRLRAEQWDREAWIDASLKLLLPASERGNDSNIPVAVAEARSRLLGGKP